MEKIEEDIPIVIFKKYMKKPFRYYYRGSARIIGIKDRKQLLQKHLVHKAQCMANT